MIKRIVRLIRSNSLIFSLAVYDFYKMVCIGLPLAFQQSLPTWVVLLVQHLLNDKFQQNLHLLRLWQQNNSSIPKNSSSKITRRRTPNEREYVQNIVNRSIFDSSQAGAKVSSTLEPAEGDSIESSLQLTLLATIIAAPEQYSVALIQEQSGVSSTYGIGYDLIGQATITKIEKSRVYFQRNNSEQIEYIEIGGEGATTEQPKVLVLHLLKMETSKRSAITNML